MIGRKRLLSAARVAVWVLVGACVVVFARRLHWAEVLASFEDANLLLAVAASSLGVPCVALQGLRWASLVGAVRKVPRRTTMAALYVGQAASAFLPMRAGEVVRTELLSRATGLHRAASLGTVALDHTVNGFVMFGIAAVLPLILPVPRWVGAVLWGGGLILIAILLVLLRLSRAPSHQHHTERSRLMQAVARLRTGLAAMRSPRAIVPAAAFAAAAWGVEIVIAMLALRAFHLPHDVPHAMGVLFGVNLAMAIPSPPAALGNFELGAGMALVAFGGDKHHAAAFALGYHALQLIPTLVMGGLLVGRFRRRPPQHGHPAPVVHARPAPELSAQSS